MGLFWQRPSAYAPPLDGSQAAPTLAGGGTPAPPPAESKRAVCDATGQPAVASR